MNSACSNPGRASGFSLIELMLAMLIGLIIMGGVMQLFISTRDTQRSSEDQLALLADARFAIDTIAYDLRHTGLWGRHNDPAIIACQNGAASYPCAGPAMPAATDDCAVGAYINIAAPLFAENDNNTTLAACASDSYKTGTDVLSLRYADTNRINDIDLAANVAYLRTSSSVGMLFIGPTFPVGTPYNDLNAPSTKYSNHLLVSRIYYVSNYTDAGDSQPSLRRGDLVAGPAGPAMNSEVLLPGVEDFQLEFGVDVGANGVAGKKDGQVDSYVNAGSVTNWSNGEVLSVRVWVLMRAERKDRDNIGSAQTFSYAGKTVTTPNDGYSRRLISSVVKLRNTFQVNLKQTGS
ncbi:MAG: PilW family protein [Gammaproteobacteria bacterium]|nr:PilW family protein [Gammaproteobacteria bacterium]